jgi:hypothetical protein
MNECPRCKTKKGFTILNNWNGQSGQCVLCGFYAEHPSTYHDSIKRQLGTYKEKEVN